jgi:hypothetical protein
MKARCGSSTGLRWPPILPGATEPIARCRCDHFTTDETATPKTLRHRPAALAGQYRRHHTLAKIQGKRSGHAMLASNPVSILNYNPPKTGIPSGSIKR